MPEIVRLHPHDMPISRIAEEQWSTVNLSKTAGVLKA